MKFTEIKLFQVKPDKLEAFEALVARMEADQATQEGCLHISYMKRFFVLDDMEPRELTRIVKCVKYFSTWEFDSKDHYAAANRWFFDAYSKEVFKLLIMPFDINCGPRCAERSPVGS